MVIYRYKYFIVFFTVLFCSISAKSQVEHVHIYHPVYKFLEHAEIKGLLKNITLTVLPLQRNEVIKALKLVRESENQLSDCEIVTLEKYETEFEIDTRKNTVVFYSKSDRDPIFFRGLFSNDEKFIYHYKDTSNAVNLQPLASLNAILSQDNSKKQNVQFGNLGFRLFGTIDNSLGYTLQVTNGVIISGNRDLAMEEHKLRQNVKFAILNSDFDFSESHIRYQNDWFYTIIGRESRLVGAGVNQRLVISDNASAMDAISLGARFSDFEYRFSHFSLVGEADTNYLVGSQARIPPKYMTMHQFSLKPTWGELSYFQTVIYSGREVELGYLNPLSFLKSIEHSLHDRDKSMMGVNFRLRPFGGLQFVGTWMLEDIIFSKIGTGYWSNKTAWNIGMSFALPLSISAGIEYTRVEPYMFTHFNRQNNRTNDGMLLGTYLNPNSDETAFHLKWFWGNRYPVEISVIYQRHGANEFDSSGNIIKNVGGDPFHVKGYLDPLTVTFLDGIREDILTYKISAGWELFRGFNLKATYLLRSIDSKLTHIAKIYFSFEDF